MNKRKEKLVRILENLFNPIENKDYGLYWLVSHEKTEPLANAEELLTYIRKESKEGSFINRYGNLTSDSTVIENNIYLDFDLTNNSYLKAERRLTETTLEELASKRLTITEKTKPSDKANNEFLKQIQQKYKENFSVENGFSKGFNSFIDSLTTAEEGALTTLVKGKEKEEVKGLSEEELKKYYLTKFENRYLEEPFKDVVKVANYFNSIGVKTILNLSGSKGFHLRIPITTIDFKGTDLEENERLFLLNLAELIETKILEKPYKKSSLDYKVFQRGMQRIPTSKHNKTKLYANFIEPSFNYLEAIDVLEEKVPSYIPELVNTEKNTEAFIESDIYKATIKKATEEATKTFKNEEANPNYKFNGKHKELKRIISKVYLPSCRNEVGFRIIHLLRRSNFSQVEVEDIFKDLHEDIKDYKETIEGSIIHAYKTEKLTGLRSLLKWLKANASEEVKEEVVKYFSRKFKYYERPEETVLEDKLNIDNATYEVIFQKTKRTEKYIVPEFITEDFTLELELKKQIILKHKEKPIAKLELNRPKETSDTTIKAKSEKKLTEFKQQILNKNIVPIDKEEPIQKFKEVITELDLIIGYFRIQQEQEEELKQMEEELSEDTEEESNVIDFSDYRQIGRKTPYKRSIGIHLKTKNRKGETELIPVANAVIEEVEIIINPLKLTKKEKELEPLYNVTYYNGTTNRVETVEYATDVELTKKLIKSKVFYNSKKENVDTVINAFIIEGTKEGRIKVKEESYLEGFFIINGKVIENTKLMNLKKYDPSEVAEAINLLNEIMKDRTEEGKANDSTVYRFMLWNPYSYCLKQIGYKTGIYSLILIGKSKANKTGAINIGNLFYLNTEEETAGSTASVLGSKLEEDSFTKVFDECYNLLNLPEVPDIMKKAVQDKVTRVTKDRTDNKKSDKFNAFGLPTFLLNERMEFKDFIRERFKIRDYTSKSYLSKTKRKAFNEKYVPEAEDTILLKLALIGNEFKKKIVPLIEAKDKRLFNPEELTIEILKEIAEETSKATGTKVAFLPEMYTITEDSTNYNYDVNKEIVKLLNTEFKQKNKLTGNNSYSGYSFTNSAINNDFGFITYNKYRSSRTEEKEFIIDSKGLVNYVNNHVEETVELENILEALDLTETLTAKAKKEKTTYSKFINKQHKIKVEGTEPNTFKDKNITGFYLTVEELANKLFSFNIDFSEKQSN